MAYSSGQIISAVDTNNFITQVNELWGSGSTDYGYGQTLIPTVNTGGNIQSSTWEELRDVVGRIAAHQGTPLTAGMAIPFDVQVGNTIDITDWQTNITNITTNRLNVDPGEVTLSALGSTSRGSAWGAGNTSIDAQISFAFPTFNEARYFINSGGTMRLDPFQSTNSTPQDASWVTFLSGVGVIELSSAGTSRSGTIGTPAAISAYDLTAVDQTIYTGSYGTGAYGGSSMSVAAKLVGSTFTFTITFTDSHGPTNGSFDQVSAGTGVDYGIAKAGLSQLNDVAIVTPTTTVPNAF